MTIIGSAVVPNMQIISKQKIQKAANELGMDLMTIRKQARANQKKYTLQVNSEGNGYTISSETDAVSALHTKDAGNDKNIKISIYYGGAVKSSMSFQGDSMQIGTSTNVEECEIHIAYKDVKTYGKLKFDQIAGSYSFEMVS